MNNFEAFSNKSNEEQFEDFLYRAADEVDWNNMYKQETLEEFKNGKKAIFYNDYLKHVKGMQEGWQEISIKMKQELNFNGEIKYRFLDNEYIVTINKFGNPVVIKNTSENIEKLGLINCVLAE